MQLIFKCPLCLELLDLHSAMVLPSEEDLKCIELVCSNGSCTVQQVQIVKKSIKLSCNIQVNNDIPHLTGTQPAPSAELPQS